jgi:hypothetical protein
MNLTLKLSAELRRDPKKGHSKVKICILIIFHHMGGLKSKSEDNAFYKHWRNCHETPCEENYVRLENYEFKAEKSYQDPISRQINEMVRISNFQGTPLNTKSGVECPTNYEDNCMNGASVG